MVLILLFINLPIFVQARFDRKLWGKSLQDSDVEKITSFTLYPTIVGIGCAIIGLILTTVTSQPRGGVPYPASIVVLLLIAVVPIIALVISIAGTLSVYYAIQDGQSRATRTSQSVNLKQAAKFLNISQDELIAMVTSGKLRARKVDGQYRFDPEILNALKGIVK